MKKQDRQRILRAKSWAAGRVKQRFAVKTNGIRLKRLELLGWDISGKDSL
jgi:hypothetical protein